ncbi:27kDa outer membrane protein [Caenispirillum salinarum AK4]|uniref:27kDa outer membrane protein n=1 Tax=Caenispirillum salinarum AK4 TaxID=1238182 RepID=K9GSB3_9PROT|nr:DsbA family protein [Caenispirillum salinarum]EKV28885.1 27kDa outer membrane protein [Caenispirillum salinarum AK4]
MPSRFTTITAAAALGAVIIGGYLAVQAVTAPTGAEAGTRPAAEMTPGGLVQGPSAVVAENPDGDVTVIEYFDYQCPICRRVHPDLKRLAEEDEGVRIVHKHWPVFGAASIYASKLALAARWQDRYREVHDALMRLPGKLDEERVREAARSAGLDIDKAEKDLDQRADEVEAVFDEAAIQAHSLQFQGTPSFVIGNYLVPGGIDYATMRRVVKDVRDQKREAEETQ